jgi:hypothetical protein
MNRSGRGGGCVAAAAVDEDNDEEDAVVFVAAAADNEDAAKEDEASFGVSYTLLPVPLPFGAIIIDVGGGGEPKIRPAGSDGIGVPTSADEDDDEDDVGGTTSEDDDEVGFWAADADADDAGKNTEDEADGVDDSEAVGVAPIDDDDDDDDVDCWYWDCGGRDWLLSAAEDADDDKDDDEDDDDEDDDEEEDDDEWSAAKRPRSSSMSSTISTSVCGVISVCEQQLPKLLRNIVEWDAKWMRIWKQIQKIWEECRGSSEIQSHFATRSVECEITILTFADKNQKQKRTSNVFEYSRSALLWLRGREADADDEDDDDDDDDGVAGFIASLPLLWVAASKLPLLLVFAAPLLLL